jgi:DNA-binding XRE family transcriptional regulator
MTANQYRSAIVRLELSQGDAAAFLGVSPRTSHGYANGSPIPEAISKLLRLMIAHGLKPEQVS